MTSNSECVPTVFWLREIDAARDVAGGHGDNGWSTKYVSLVSSEGKGCCALEQSALGKSAEGRYTSLTALEICHTTGSSLPTARGVKSAGK